MLYPDLAQELNLKYSFYRSFCRNIVYNTHLHTLSFYVKTKVQHYHLDALYIFYEKNIKIITCNLCPRPDTCISEKIIIGEPNSTVDIQNF